MATDQTDRQIRAALDDRADRGTPRGADAVVATAWARHADPLSEPVTALPTRRHRARRLAAVAAAVLLIAGYAVVRLRPDPDSVVVIPGATTTTTVPSAPIWHEVGSLDITDRVPNLDAAPVWTGSELVLAGLNVNPALPAFPRPLAESPALDPATGRIRLIAPPPVMHPLDTISPVWTGRELLFVTLTNRPEIINVGGSVRGVAYDPARDSWRTIATPPAVEQLIWAGDRAIGWTASSFVAYDPGADRWSDLGPSSFRELGVFGLPYVQALWTGSQVVAVGQATRIFDPASGAVTVADPPPFLPEQAVWTGSRVVIYSTQAGGVAAMFDPVTRTWRRGRVRPGREVSDSRERVAWADDRLVVWGGDFGSARATGREPVGAVGTASYDPASDTWTQLPPLPAIENPVSGAAVGDDLVVFAYRRHTSVGPFTLTAWKLS
jgi:hypothetical protein